jgi:hypothetical protein
MSGTSTIHPGLIGNPKKPFAYTEAGTGIAVGKSLGLYRQCSGARVWVSELGICRSIADTAISSKPLAGSYGY